MWRLSRHQRLQRRCAAKDGRLVVERQLGVQGGRQVARIGRQRRKLGVECCEARWDEERMEREISLAGWRGRDK